MKKGEVNVAATLLKSIHVDELTTDETRAMAFSLAGASDTVVAYFMIHGIPAIAGTVQAEAGAVNLMRELSR